MKPFAFKHAGEHWPAGKTLLHVYALVDLDRDRELAALIAGGRKALDGWPLTFVEDRWLHITLDQVTDHTSEDIGESERDALSAALTQRMRAFAPFTVMVGSLLSYHSGVIADLHPDEQLTGLHHAVRDTIRSVRGRDAVRYPWSTQHLTLAYASGDADSDQAQRQLRRVRPSHAPLHIDAVHLVDVTADATAKTITWDHLAAIPLGASR
ncbi:2'-5' RNA ligase family protein [Streptomyces kaniharaensis]|uniref:2'-5' RNA ligase family protein n=1 Tax=Streptomyces kaniharaensis TaxID=212423 RepID=A0A6N7L170_9ACTN|nr:2'-5' RNA ligase family protein [Streptomyces kaniharaensis]MQS17391.1 2'-5' RNA ligase family protein [Streptomyces kaniharaensis]